jgi:glycine hydroxymethyltransferase
VPYAHVVTTTTHKTLRGPRGGLILWNDESLNFNKAVFPGIQGGPLEHVIAAKAVSFMEALQPSFKEYQKNIRVNAKALADALVGKGFKLVSGGTDNHLMLLDFSKTELSGKNMEDALGKVHITVNKNTVPNENRSPFVTSGVRMGTPALTSRGMGTAEMQQIAGWVRDTFDNFKDEAKLKAIGAEVVKLSKRFPLYPQWKG